MEITFPSASSSDASVFASELRTLLLGYGVSRDSIILKRTNAEHMDVGGALEIARMGVETVLAMHATFNLMQLIHEFSKRNRCTIRIRSEVANVDVSTNTADQKIFVETLQKLAKAYHASPRK
jgi:hypothetical protein